MTLAGAGHDVIWAADWSTDPGDEQILRRAFEEGRVLLTLDKDFGTLAVAQGIPHSGIVRLVGFRASEQGAAAMSVLVEDCSALEKGSLVTVEPGRVRIRS